MRLLFVSHSSGLLGAERSLLEIAEGAVEDGHSVTVAMPSDGPLAARLAEAGVTCVFVDTKSWLGPRHWIPPLGLFRLIQARRSVARFQQVIRETRADAVVTNTIVLPAPSWAAKKMAVPHIWIVRESVASNRQLRSLVTKRHIVRSVFDRSDAVCAISEYVETQLQTLHGHPTPRIWRVQPNPRLTESAGGQSPPKYPGELRLLLPGFLSPEKGQHRAVLALARARRQGAEGARLTLVGRGSVPYTLLIRALIVLTRSRSHVQLLGWTPNLDSHYAAAHATLVTSANEAYGRVFVESLTRGIPVLAFRRGAAAEVIGSDGGILVDHWTIRALAAAVAQVSSEDQNVWDTRLANAARRGLELSSEPTQYEHFRAVLEQLGSSARTSDSQRN